MSVTLYATGTPALEMLDGRRHTRRIGPGSFRVLGRRGAHYSIAVERGVPFCDCDAGRRRRACWHAALVLARLRRESRQEVAR